MWRKMFGRFRKNKNGERESTSCGSSSDTVESSPSQPEVPADPAITPVVPEVPADSAITPVVPEVSADLAITPVVPEVPADLAITPGGMGPAQHVSIQDASKCTMFLGRMQDTTVNVVQNIQQNVITPNAAACGSKEHKNTGRECPAHVASTLCEEELRSIYREEGSYLQRNPFEDDDKEHYGKIFTKLELEDCNKKPILVEEIFDLKTEDGNAVKRAILNGYAGKGKTTLMGKLAYDWGRGESLKQFKLVFFLRMSLLNQESDLIEAIYDQLLAKDTKVKRGDLESFIQSNQDKVLILLDGFDELQTTSLSQHKFGSVLDVLNRKMFKDCWAVVTTRPSHFHTLVSKSLIEKPYTHVRVLGFNKQDISEYVHKFYSEEQDQEKVDRLLKIITDSDFLSDLATSPVLLLWLCLLWREYSTLPETLWGTSVRQWSLCLKEKELTRMKYPKL